MTTRRRTVSAAEASGPRRPGPLERQRRRLFWPFVGPALAVYGVLFLAPIAYAAWTSLYKWDGMGEKQWKGLDNYRILLDDPTFATSILNTLKILVVGGLLTFFISFLLTLVLREMRAKLFARSVLFFPNLVNAMVFGAVAGFVFSPDGPVNVVLGWVGVDTPPKWLAIDNVFPLIIGTLVWTATGYYTTIIMAAVDQIPPYLYEAAELEGASAFQRLRHITIPLSWDVVTVCAVLWTVSSVKVFEMILLFGGSNSGNPPTQTWTTAMYVYTSAFPTSSVPKMGLASAAALVSLVMVGLFTVLLRRIMRRDPIQY
ncbi:sugar ABC transporter permease [Nonomuraea sp. NBC_01738]|uniref:carbohydrate ABC transporter permease n=1 Tax=Nonomuraea sp. NBC_01738 TaxID=2976003 RepID=UPI002E119CCB|nr:sugar ABC transporter permease [Nonomuraea sp. NBC_01738]